MTVLGALLLSWFLLVKRARRLGHPAAPVLVFLVMGLLVGTLGGHAFNFLIPAVFGMKSAELSGLTVIGSAVSTIAFGWLYLPRALGIEPGAFYDAAAFTMPLCIMIGRFGCLLNGCCFGTFCPAWAGASALGVFTIRAASYSPHSYAGELLRGTPGDALLWNLQLMFMLHELAVLLVAETLYRNRERWRLPPGTVIAAAVAQETAGRFFLEFVRWDEAVPGTAFNPWQLSVLALFLLSSALLAARLSRRGFARISP